MKTAKVQPKTKVQTTIGPMTFRQVNERRFVVRCRGQARIRILLNRAGQWEGTTVPAHANRHGVELVTLGETPERCFKRAAKAFWPAR